MTYFILGSAALWASASSRAADVPAPAVEGKLQQAGSGASDKVFDGDRDRAGAATVAAASGPALAKPQVPAAAPKSKSKIGLAVGASGAMLLAAGGNLALALHASHAVAFGLLGAGAAVGLIVVAALLISWLS